MSIINEILDGDARPQPLSPLFTRLSPELRLMIYTFVFMGCQAWLRLKMKPDGYGRDVEGPDWEGRGEERDVSRYYHFGGGFGLLRTCRLAYIEAFDTYWSEMKLLKLDGLHTFETYCNYLPAAIKVNLRHIRGARLPMLGISQAAVEKPYRVFALLTDFPKLISCAFFMEPPEIFPSTPEWCRIPHATIIVQEYEGVGPFEMKSGESPAAYMERITGVRLSDGVTLLSEGFCIQLGYWLEDLKTRWQFFNWATGMVYQTSSDLGHIGSTAWEDAYQQAMRAKPGDEWFRSYRILD